MIQIRERKSRQAKRYFHRIVNAFAANLTMTKKNVGLKRIYSPGNVEPEGKKRVKTFRANEFFLDKAVDRNSNN
jgi:hypothetical protein